jgi:hypothetical protein
MNHVPIEMLQEIGLYLDPKSYYRLRNSFQSALPLQQRILPCYFDYRNVGVLLEEVIEKDVLDDVIKLTEVDQNCIELLLDYYQFDVLVPFAPKVLEMDPDFYHVDKIRVAIADSQSVYLKALFKQPLCFAGVTKLYHYCLHRNLCHNELKSIPPEIGQLSSLNQLYLRVYIDGLLQINWHQYHQ